MPIKAKYNGSYKDITDLMNVDESIDYVLAKTSSSYKRVYTATRSIEDAPPTTFKSIKSDANLTDYRIYGQTVDGESVGDRTGNLFDETIYDKNVANNTAIYVPIYVGNVNYVTCSTNCPKTIYSVYDSDNSRYIFILSGNVNTGAKNDINGVSNGAPRTIQPSNGYVTICYRKIESYNVRPWEYQTMLNSGSTPLPYEPYGYKVPVTVEGKNLFEITKFDDDSVSKTVDGITFTISNNKVIYSGTSTATYPQVSSPELPLVPGESYYAKIIVKGSYEGRVYIFFRGKETPESAKANYKQITPSTKEVFTAWYNTSVLYVAQGNNKQFDVSVEVVITKVPSITTPIYLPEQIKKAGDEVEYIDYGEQKQHRVRKNLLQNTATSKTVGRDESDPDTYPGVTFTVNADGSVTCNGTANIDAYLPLKYTPNLGTGTFILSGCPVGGSNLTYSLQYTKYILSENGTIAMSVNYDDTGSGATIEQFDYDGFPSSAARIRIASGYTCDNLTFYPMIRKADIEDDTYEPYIENTEVDVTLPALPTLPGTNVLSVGTEVQPSKIDITGHIKTISGGS